jgi:hypothetical protein
MAYIWHGVANFSDESLATAFAKNFDRSVFTLPFGESCDLRLGVEKNSSGWEVCIVPYVFWDAGEAGHLNGHGGADTPEEVATIDACANVIYKRLSSGLSDETMSYDFALTGFEVGDWRSRAELVKDLAPDGLYREYVKLGFHTFDGLVVTRPMWWEAESPDGFERFSPDHMWIPFRTIEDSQ